MLRLRPKATSASKVKATLLPTEVMRPLKLFLLFQKSISFGELFCVQLKTSCAPQGKTFPRAWLSADFWQIYLKNWKVGVWAKPYWSLWKNSHRFHQGLDRALKKSEVIEKSVLHGQNMKFSLGLDLLDSLMVMWKSKYILSGVSDVHIALHW